MLGLFTTARCSGRRCDRAPDVRRALHPHLRPGRDQCRRARPADLRRLCPQTPTRTTAPPSRPHGSRGAPTHVRRRVLDRDQHRCQLRYSGCLGVATEVDHVRNVAAVLHAGGTRQQADDPSNLAAVCSSCHSIKTAREQRTGSAASNQRRAVYQFLVLVQVPFVIILRWRVTVGPGSGEPLDHSFSRRRREMAVRVVDCASTAVADCRESPPSAMSTCSPSAPSRIAQRGEVHNRRSQRSDPPYPWYGRAFYGFSWEWHPAFIRPMWGRDPPGVSPGTHPSANRGARPVGLSAFARAGSCNTARRTGRGPSPCRCGRRRRSPTRRRSSPGPRAARP